MEKNRYIIGVGSNITPQKNIERAEQILPDSIIIIEQTQSKRTIPIGMPNAPMFLNKGWLIETVLNPNELKQVLKEIEKKLGRDLDSKWKNRPIDLDIISVNKTIIDPDYHTRDFLKEQTDQLLLHMDTI